MSSRDVTNLGNKEPWDRVCVCGKTFDSSPVEGHLEGIFEELDDLYMYFCSGIRKGTH